MGGDAERFLNDQNSESSAPSSSDPVTGSDPVEQPEQATDPEDSSALEPLDNGTARHAGDVTPETGRKRFGRRPSTAPAAKRRKVSRLELPILIVVAIAIAIVLKTFVIQPFFIPSQSMEQTLHGCPGCTGDRILVFKPVYKFRDPHPGDIIVFKAPENWDEAGGVALSTNPIAHGIQWFGQLVGVVPPSEKDLVKRVIATGGQTVKCCDENGNVEVSDNGPDGPWRSLNEPYIFENSPWTRPTVQGVRPPGDTRSFGPVTIPKDRLWVMGDHRGDSADSRYHCGNAGVDANCDPDSSTVPISDVIGKAVVIAWPPSRWRTLGTPKTFQSMGEFATSPAAPAGIGLAGVLVVGRWRRRRRR